MTIDENIDGKNKRREQQWRSIDGESSGNDVDETDEGDDNGVLGLFHSFPPWMIKCLILTELLSYFITEYLKSQEGNRVEMGKIGGFWVKFLGKMEFRRDFEEF